MILGLIQNLWGQKYLAKDQLAQRRHHEAAGHATVKHKMTKDEWLSVGALIVLCGLNILFWAALNPDTAALLRQVSIEPLTFLGQTMAILGIPMALGMLTVAYLPKLADFFRRPLQILSFLFLIAFIGGAMLSKLKYLSTFVLSILPFVVLHNAIAIALGWGTARVLRLSDYASAQPSRPCGRWRT